MKEKTHTQSLPPGFRWGNLLTTLRCPQRGLSSQSLDKYWQLNQSNQHTSTYGRIQQQTKNPYYATINNENAQENPRINQQDRQKIMFHGSANPRRSPSSTLPLHTQKQCTARGSSWGVFHPVSDHWRLLDPPWGRVAKPIVSPLTPVPPNPWWGAFTFANITSQW